MKKDQLIMNIADELDAMDWHGLRYIDYLPKHFIKCKMETPVDEMLQWLEANTNGRFAIAPDTKQDFERNYFVRQRLVIGFENPMEATLYTLSHR
jgi:hypothetical protein